MPSKQSHREQAEYNEEAALSIRDTSPDWAVTMCFYAALHWVEWYAKVRGDELERQYQNYPSPHIACSLTFLTLLKIESTEI